MTICRDCRFLQTVKQPTFPVFYQYYCKAGIEDVNYIGMILPENEQMVPKWCPIVQGFVTENQD